MKEPVPAVVAPIEVAFSAPLELLSDVNTPVPGVVAPIDVAFTAVKVPVPGVIPPIAVA